MTEPVVIELFGPPRGKGRPRFVRTTGRAYTDEKTERYEDNLSIVASRAMEGRGLIDGPILLKMVAVFGVPASWSNKRKVAALAGAIRPTVKPDADNIMKLTDALNGVVWIDDKQVVTATFQKVYGLRPMLSLEVVPITAEAA